MSHIVFRIENCIPFGLQPEAATIPINGPVHQPGAVTLNHMLANPAKN